ncbi:MAG: ferrochelatase [Alphaproteobacteria bacterium]
MSERLAVVLFNLGGPDSLDAVQPYLRNLFSDPAIIRLPGLFRLPIARFIADRRAPYAREEIFAKIGGRSPIVPETEAQANLLKAHLDADTRIFVAMRYWSPRADTAAREIVSFAPDRVVLLPLYPQFSTTTTESSFKEFEVELAKVGYRGKIERICCYPTSPGFIAALAETILPELTEAHVHGVPRLLFSAHGLPQSVVTAGDPYVWQVEQTAAAVIDALGTPLLDWSICYQSRVGPLKWTGPSIDEEIARAAADSRVIVIAPIAFVSEHSETLVELDIKYKKIAGERGAPGYFRVPAVSVNRHFIAGLASLVREAACHDEARAYCNPRLCPGAFKACPNV